ncbi:hypothetical protein KUL156_54000 [Alteromonas sp. KUL156]|nr:hypothetical protein KUL154_10620 [Alteromonas sp. KUL154]GFE02808.1 hypothetical protein KUL156_54000 [Alteromonas sp. KUL156]
MSFFQTDLTKEKILSIYLDKMYTKLNLNFDRVINLELQHKGVDLIFHARDKDYFIDEKSQLHYINSDLPTFTFELSYLKNKVEKTGWFLDNKMITTHYFLITGIYAVDKKDLNKGFKKCKITSVNKRKLKQHLTSIGLTDKKLLEYNKNIRLGKESKKIEIDELDLKKEGAFFYSPQYSEKPINLQLRLDFLINNKIAKRII